MNGSVNQKSSWKTLISIVYIGTSVDFTLYISTTFVYKFFFSDCFLFENLYELA